IYGQLWDAVHPVALGVCFGCDAADAELKEPSDAQIRNAAFKLLAANYVVDMPELVSLGCLQNDGTFRTIVLASCRGQWLLDALRDIQKKDDPQAASGLDTSAGNAA